MAKKSYTFDNWNAIAKLFVRAGYQ